MGQVTVVEVEVDRSAAAQQGTHPPNGADPLVRCVTIMPPSSHRQVLRAHLPAELRPPFRLMCRWTKVRISQRQVNPYLDRPTPLTWVASGPAAVHR